MAAKCKVSIIMLGESGVGKTSLVRRFSKGTFIKHRETIIDVEHKKIVLGGRDITLEIWDTAGSERFRTLVRGYFRKAEGVLLVYDVTDITTFHKLSSWLQELRVLNEEAIPIIVGNKCENPDVKAVSISAVKSYAEQEKIEYFEASAKNNENVTEIFEYMAKTILRSRQVSSSPQKAECIAENESDLHSLEDSFSVVKFVNRSNSHSSAISTAPNGSALPPIVQITDNDIINLCVEEQPKKQKKKCC